MNIQARLLLTEWLCTARYVRKNTVFKEISNCPTHTYNNSYSSLRKENKTTHTSGSQALISQSRTNIMTRKDDFSNDLCEALIASNIPSKKTK
jgi:hypothetical protein